MTSKVGMPIRSNHEWLELLGRKPGDPEREAAVGELYETLYAKAYFICTHQCDLAREEARTLAADVAADQICKVLEGRGLDNFRGEAHFLTYITWWVHNAIMSSLRSVEHRHARATLSLDLSAADGESMAIDPPDPTQLDTQVWHISPNLAQALTGCFAALEDEERIILWLKRVEREPAKSLAITYGMTQNAINLCVSRAAKRVKECLAAKGFALDDIWGEDAQ